MNGTLLLLLYRLCHKMGRGNTYWKGCVKTNEALASLIDANMVQDVNIGGSRTFVLTEEGIDWAEGMIRCGGEAINRIDKIIADILVE